MSRAWPPASPTPASSRCLRNSRVACRGFIARELPDGNPLILALLNIILRRRMRHPTAGWGLRRGLWTHGVKSPLDYIRLTENYSLEGRAEQIRCPTLVCSAENDEIGVTARRLFDTLTCRKSFIVFTASDGADAHCEAGARALFNQHAFDWLDTVLDLEKRTGPER